MGVNLPFGVHFGHSGVDMAYLGFWKDLKRPIAVLAPMADVTDAAFRRIITKYGKFTRPDGSVGGGPDAMWTEFVSCDGLCSAGRNRLLKDLEYMEAERPIIAQFFGATPTHFYECAGLAVELGFDGIDINMGCPDRAVERQGAGSALIKTPELAKEIIYETIRGAQSTGKKLPVSVKTRIGYGKNQLKEWVSALLEAEPAVITVHARTRKEMSKVPADWDAVREAVEIAHRYDSSDTRTLVFGNGDVNTLEEGKRLALEAGADGVMVGRGIFGNPWLFAEGEGKREISIEEKLRVMLEHTELFEEVFRNPNSEGPRLIKNFDVMKKHFKAYVNGFDGAKELRMKFMETKDANEVRQIAETYLANFKFQISNFK